MKKLILPLLACTLSMTSCINTRSDDSNEAAPEPQIKTNFSSCDELKKYVQYYEYSSIAAKWGPGEIGEPWNSSGLHDDKKMMVIVEWKNVTLNGKSVKIWYENASEYVTTKNPFTFSGVQCEDF